MTTFAELQLEPSIERALRARGYVAPTPIQAAAIPSALAGKDIIGTAQTGTGKTAAFALPLLHLLFQNPVAAGRGIRALILTPTRELALQIEENLRLYGKHLSLSYTLILGGMPIGAQLRALQKNPDIVVGTPGRLLDLLRRKALMLGEVEHLVLDEADRMLDMGFIQDVRTLISQTPKSRQVLLFSATMSPQVLALGKEFLKDPVQIEVSPQASVSVNIEQRVMFVTRENKRALLGHVLKDRSITRVLVFTRTKHGANKLATQLSRAGIRADAIHSNKSQNARQRALKGFARGTTRVLVATDIVARGIDVPDVTHVINFELPDDPENYVHRIGRTARGGAEGTAFSFCDAEELDLLRTIEKLTKQRIEMVDDHEFHAAEIVEERERADARRPQRRHTRGNRRPRSGGPGRPNNFRSNSSRSNSSRSNSSRSNNSPRNNSRQRNRSRERAA